MGINYTGNINSSVTRASGNFTEIENIDGSIVNSGDCFIGSGESFIKNIFDNECRDQGDFTRGRYERPTDAPFVPYQSYEPGPFASYGGPTHETANNFYKDVLTKSQQHQEYIARGSPGIIVAKLDREQTSVDQILGEAVGNEVFKKGIAIEGYVELNKIIMELSRFGLAEGEDVLIEFNYDRLVERLGRVILPGDMLAITLTTPRVSESTFYSDPNSKTYDVAQVQKIYRVMTSVPTKLFLHHYLAIEVSCKKTNLSQEIFYDWNDYYAVDEVPPDINSESNDPLPVDLP